MSNSRNDFMEDITTIKQILLSWAKEEVLISVQYNGSSDFPDMLLNYEIRTCFTKDKLEDNFFKFFRVSKTHKPTDIMYLAHHRFLDIVTLIHMTVSQTTIQKLKESFKAITLELGKGFDGILTKKDFNELEKCGLGWIWILPIYQTLRPEILKFRESLSKA